ncbi:AMP-binding protein [Cuniculiplasma sp. SKW4]|uniref:AMP-binding protein n=1 Tax=Cuniculiplasma sp. SKW4 TaxID=3400171 RepID=UPI003FD19C4D
MGNEESFRSPSDILESVSKNYESYPAIFYGGNVWSYSDIRNMVRSLSWAIMDKFSVKKGDIIGVCLPQSIQSFLSYYAIWNNGLVALPIDSKMPISAIDSIISSGKLSGMITYEGLYSKINREDTSSIFNLLTDPGDFLSHFQSPSEDFLLYKPKGTRQRAVFEEICYGNDKEQEKIDPYTDYAIANIIWNRSGSFSLVKFTYGAVIESFIKETQRIQSRENSTFLQNYEPSDAASVVFSYLYPMNFGHTIAMEHLKEVDDLKKAEKKLSIDGHIILNVHAQASDFLRNIEQRERDTLSLIFARGKIQDEILSSLKERKSSVFMFLFDQHSMVPIFVRQSSEAGRFVKFSDDMEFMKVESIKGRIHIKGSSVVSEDGKEEEITNLEIVNNEPQEIISLDQDQMVLAGKTFPLSHMEKKISRELGIDDFKITLENGKIKLISGEKINTKDLINLLADHFPPELLILVKLLS